MASSSLPWLRLDEFLLPSVSPGLGTGGQAHLQLAGPAWNRQPENMKSQSRRTLRDRIAGDIANDRP